MAKKKKSSLVTQLNTKVLSLELRLWAEERGYPSGSAKPVMQNILLNGWNVEVLMLKGLDLLYMPHFVTGEKPKKFPCYKLEGEARTKIHAFCECLGFQLTRDTFMDHKKLFELGCRPFYNPVFDNIMSSANYAFSLRQLSGVHAPKTHKQVAVEPDLEIADENPDGGPARRSKKQKRKSVTLTPGSGANAEIDVEENVAKPGDDGDRIGKYSLEEFEQLVSDIPREEDRKAMGDSGIREVLRGLIGDLGKATIKAAGVSALMKKKDDKLTNSIKVKDQQILELGKSLSELKVFYEEEVSGLKGDLIAEQDRVTDLERRLSEAEKKLEAVKPEQEVIEKFQKTDAYNQAIVDASAPEILRAWKVAEKLIKTDPVANWDSFIDAFIVVKEAIERGEGEPEFFVGPNPLIFQVNPAGAHPLNPGN